MRCFTAIFAWMLLGGVAYAAPQTTDIAVLTRHSTFPTVVAGNNCNNAVAGPVGTLACTLPIPVSSGDKAFVVVGTTNPTAPVSAASDKGDSCGAVLDTVSTIYKSVDFFCSSLTAGASTITVTLGGSSSFDDMIVTVYRNTSGVDVHTAASQTTPGTATDAVSSGNVTTTKANDLLVGTVLGYTATGTFAVGTSYTLDLSLSIGSSEHFFTPGPVTKAATFTASSTSVSSNTFLVALKP